MLSHRAILELLRNAFEIASDDRGEVARNKIAGHLLLLDEAFREMLPLVFDFLGVPDSEHPPPQLDPEVRERQLFDFVRRLVQARSQREPLVLFIDDAHWIDPASDAYLSQLAEAVNGTRTLLLVNFRPEYQADWMEKSYYQQLRLRPLGPEAIEELLRDLIGQDPTVEGLPGLIRERTSGNPFFIEETVRFLAESGSLEGALGAYRLAKPVETLEVPTTVQPVLAARMDRLPEREKQLLQTAAVIGRKFPEPLVRRVAELPDSDLAAALSHLREAEFIREEVLYPEVEYAFAHPLTHEVAYDSQLSGRRSQAHASVARALEELHPDKLDENAALLAYHFGEAGESLVAARWHRRAARWVSSTDMAEELRHWSRVLDLVEGLPDAEAADLGLKAITALMPRRTSQAASLLRRGRQLAERTTDPRDLPQLLVSFGAARLTAGETAEGLGAMREAKALTGELVDPSLGLGIDVIIGLALLSLGRLTQSTEMLERILAEESTELRKAELMLAPLKVTARVFLAWTFFEGGKLVKSADALATTRRLASGLTLGVLAEATIRMTECRVVAHQGDLERGLHMATEMVEVAQRSHNLDPAWVLVLGEIQSLCGHWQEASAALESSLTVARESGLSLNLEARILVHLARAQLGLGQGSQAVATAEEAIAVARTRGARHHEAYAYIVHADALLATTGIERLDLIEQAHSHAEQLIAETEAALIAPNLCESRGSLARLHGDDTAHRHHLREAHRLYTEMGAMGHAERVGRELERLV